MTNERKIIFIEGFEDKPMTKNNSPHCIFNTTLGPMGCFEESIINELKKLQPGHSAEIEMGTSTDGKYKNIRGLIGIRSGDDMIEEVKKQAPIVDRYVKPTNNNAHTTMYVSYAKDLCVALYESNKEVMQKDSDKCMEQAIKLIKQAQGAFK